MSEKPIDLSSLGYFYDERSEQLAQRILERCAKELGRRNRVEGFTFFDGLLAWTRPALGLAASLAVFSLIVLARQAHTSISLPLFHAVALPPAAESWLLEGDVPLSVDVFAIQEDR